MINHVHLKHFKCFESLDLPLLPLTLLTGVNAGGKSRVIQSLLLLKQSRSTLKVPPKLMLRLNGADVSLGTVGDVVDEITAREHFSIGLSDSQSRMDVKCNICNKDALVASVDVIKTETWNQSEEDKEKPDSESSLWRLISRLLHVSTERIGPRETYGADTSAPEDAWHLGPRGEYTAWILHQRAEDKVAPDLCQPGSPPTLQRQVEAWLGIFFPGAGLEVKRIHGTNLLTMRLRTSPASGFHRLENVGYGLTHILPIIVGALAVETGGVLVVENPETHLHPSAQAMMGVFLAKVAGAGRQVIIESHSDHVLNGLRRAVKDKLIPAAEVALHFFNRRPLDGEQRSHVLSPTINDAGRIDHWPQGFFDQYEKDLDALTSWD